MTMECEWTIRFEGDSILFSLICSEDDYEWPIKFFRTLTLGLDGIE
jgi:hypothetical protein